MSGLRVKFLLPADAQPGGLVLATVRLASVLAERGHACELIARCELPAGELPLEGGATLSYVSDARALADALRKDAPDLLVLGEGDPPLIDLAASIAPSVLHAHVSAPACPDGTRYWHRVARPCKVKAGWRCLAIRPLLGCTGMPETLSPTPVRRQHELLARLRSGAIGAIALSGPQALLLRAHGVRKLTLIPNLGLRMSGEAIAEAASHTSTAERSLIAYFGRLSKAKGAALLPALAAQAAPGTFAAYGDGYLQAHLRARIGEDLRTPVSQHELAGIMCWARAVAFPSRWPEPGGIVGIDAQLFGAPLGAFAVGGALDWPSAERFALSDARSLIDWLCAQPGVSQPRDPALIAERQARYWQQVGARADVALSAFASTGRFPQLVLDAVTRDLTFALEQSAA